MNKLLTFSLLLVIVLSCDIKPAKINYGQDGCHFCSMTIVDKQHAAELLNTKGKAFKYDAIECMLNDLNKRSASEVGLILVNDYNNPGALIRAEEATYLISESIPSPMGAFLSAGMDRALLDNLQKVNGGDVYTWLTIKQKFEVD